MQLTVTAFGKRLIETEDLDPVYTMLAGAKLPKTQLKRWCLAYWMFYHVGVASKASEYSNKEYWDFCREWAGAPSSARGTERRHFRGPKAPAAVSWLEAKYDTPEKVLDGLWEGWGPVGSSIGYAHVVKIVKTWPMFGPWIAFKIADMVDRVLNVPVDFSSCELDIFEDPLKGGTLVHMLVSRKGCTVLDALEVWERSSRTDKLASLRWSLDYLGRKTQLGALKAPPFQDRLINVQELETVLCKYKSHLNGRYPIGKDTLEILHALKATECATAKKLIKHLPEGRQHG